MDERHEAGAHSMSGTEHVEFNHFQRGSTIYGISTLRRRSRCQNFCTAVRILTVQPLYKHAEN